MQSRSHWLGQGLRFGTKSRVEQRPSRRRRPQTANLEVLEYRTLLSGPPTSIPQHYPNIRIAELAYAENYPTTSS